MFSETANNVIKARLNFSAPESMKLKDSVKPTEMQGKTIKIDEIIVSIKPKKDKQTKEVVLTKKGEVVYQPTVFVAFDGNKYFATNSRVLVEQLETISNQKINGIYETKEINVGNVNNLTCKISSTQVKYRDGNYYQQMIFVDSDN